MNKITTSPSNAVWTKHGRWYGRITIYSNDTRQRVEIERDFDHEYEAMEWRATFMLLLRDASLEIHCNPPILDTLIAEAQQPIEAGETEDDGFGGEK